mmetsp:Transcript_33935/g.78372  ORF Transcript_33935/g.78372 Transcript_33935/m.78372 type:complete len:123 (-) Transcript_33935:6-374(-)
MAQARKLEDGLLHIEQIAVPSVIFFEQCHNRYLSEHMSFIEVMSIWNAVGHAIFDQYMRGKGTKIDFFGTFSLDISNTPIFLPDQAIMKRFRLRPHKVHLFTPFQRARARAHANAMVAIATF